MSKHSILPPRRALVGLSLVIASTLVLVACGLKPEERIKDPDCDHCYKLESGVKYKTFEYYDP